MYICKVINNEKTEIMKAETLSQFTQKEKAANRLAMFEAKVIEFGKLINQARKDNNSALEKIYIDSLIQCEKMIAICKVDFNNL